jgi:hypothetical protein
MSPPPTELAIFGERCSGTNYVEALLQENFPQLTKTKEYGWKHGFIQPRYIKPSCFFVGVTRHALDWLRSFYRTPHQVGPWIETANFGAFLRHEWSCVATGRVLGRPNRVLGLTRDAEMIGERHPVTGARIDNVVQMRNLKLQSLLKLQNLSPNIAFLRYEDARDAPEDMLHMLAQRMGLPTPNSIKEIAHDVSRKTERETGAPRVLTPLPEFTQQDLYFVAGQLDLAQEAVFGYEYPSLR